MQIEQKIRVILGGNGAFSLLCGVIILINLDGLIATMFATQAPWQMALFFCLGLGLLFYAAILFVLVSSRTITVPIVWVFIGADASWVLGSALILLLCAGQFTGLGLALIAGIALIVGGFGVAQWRAVQHMKAGAGPFKLGKWRWGAVGAALLGLSFSLLAGISGLMAATEDMPPAPGKLYEVNGQRIHIHCRGEGGPTIIADMGVTNWSLHWQSVGDQIAQTTRFCAYDRFGFGWSGSLQSEITPHMLVDNLHQLLAQSGETGPYILLGHSFGGYVARLYRDQYPERVAGLVLVEAAHEEQWDRFPEEVGQATAAAVELLGMAKTIAYTGGLRFIDLPAADPLPSAEQLALQDRAMRSLQFYHSAEAHFAAVPALADAVANTAPLGHTPLLVITGGRSAQSYCGEQFGVDVPCDETQRVWDELQAELASLSARSIHAIAPEARHTIQLDEPAFVVEAICGFVAQIKG
ncbi:alpha/beta fold hydrolase [Maritalea mediterranea]|uniref:Alpha/beta hydrolase n=1 Tax=Maritalea mediterranea TaxID=2909667 RepID=A0ABS9E647_9HYPH|nr:alpha/beta hydrolase [Maritalea mediterranea]MCF4098331.1 alpha/beta hydrolase [Maritalea mediterranea]